MSTRSQIGIYAEQKAKPKEFEALLYRHSDGYPSGVLPDIMPFLAWWAKGRGMNDTEYVSARLLQYLCNQYDGDTMRFKSEYVDKGTTSDRVKEEYKKEMEDTKRFTGELGHGICKQFHWDIEYFYAVKPEGVEVYEVVDAEAEKFKKLALIPYENYEADKNYQTLTKQ